MTLWNPEWDPLAPCPLFFEHPIENTATKICAHICVQNIAFMHGHVQKWQGFDLVLPQVSAFTSNNKYDKHALLCLQFHKQGHVFLLTMLALGCLCDQLLYIIFKLPHVYIFPKTCPLNKKGPAWLWHGQRASLQLITSWNAIDRNAPGLFVKKTSISCLSENITYSLKGELFCQLLGLCEISLLSG